MKNKKTILLYAVVFLLILLLGIGIGILITDKDDKGNNKKEDSKPMVAVNSELGNAAETNEDGNTKENKTADADADSVIDIDEINTETDADNTAISDNDSATDDEDLTGKNDTADEEDLSGKEDRADEEDLSGKEDRADEEDLSGKEDTADNESTSGKENIEDKENTSGKNDDTIKNDATGKADKTDKSDVNDKKDTSDDKVKNDSNNENEKSKNNVLTYSSDNSWVSGSTNMYGVQFGITNNSKNTISGWTLVLDIDGLSSVDGWNGTFTVNGNKLTVKDAGYNADIYLDGTVVIGCNLGTTAAKINIKSATLNGQKMDVVSGKVDQNKQGNNEDKSGNSGNGGSSDNGGNTGNNDQISGNSDTPIERSKDAVQGDDWLHTDGHKILDKNGKQVWLTGVNWFGYNTGTNTFDGLWNSQLAPTVKSIADHGFNLIRVPISAELLNQWASGEYPRANYNNAYNTELNSMNSLEIFDYFLTLAEANGLKVMPDIHSAETNASGHNVNMWCTDKVSVNDYYHALEWLAERYKDNDTIIAIDLKNEPHGKPYEGKSAAIWNDSKAANNWKFVAETAAAKILAKNPNVLIMVEGTEIYPINLKTNSDYHSTDDKDYFFNWWGGNLRAVKDYPIDLGKYQNKLVYSPHDYGPTVFKQPWFEGKYTYDSLMKDCWHDNWFYIYEDNIAPLLIGEWGGFMTEPNITWMTYMRQLIKKYNLNHTFWCLNANSGDTGGLLLDDFKTWDTEKYNFVKEVLWQEGGKFVGLDHAIPLGENGISLSKAKGLK